MAEKAVLVTDKNLKALRTRFEGDISEDSSEIFEGYYLVLPFSEDGTWVPETLSPETFNQLYTVGETLRNDFVEAIRK